MQSALNALLFVKQSTKMREKCAHPQASKPASQPAANQPAKQSGRQPSQRPSIQLAQASPAHPKQVSARSHITDNPFSCAFFCDAVGYKMCEYVPAIQPIANRRPVRQSANQRFRMKTLRLGPAISELMPEPSQALGSMGQARSARHQRW